MTFIKKLKNKYGFTMTEVIIVVAIITILGAVFAPNIIRQQKNLQQMELNETARQIALSVQNRLVEIKSAGILYTFDDKGNVKLDALGGADKLKEEEKNVKYSFSSDTYSGPLKASTLDVIEGQYTVTFLIQTGDVTSVRYTKNGTDFGVYTMSDTDTTSIPDNFASIDQTIKPIVELSNDNEIKLVVKIEDLITVGGNYKDKFTYRIKLSYADDKEIIINAQGVTTEMLGTGGFASSEMDLTDIVSTLEVDGKPYIGLVYINADVSYDDGTNKYLTDAASTRNFAVFHNLFGNGTFGNTIDVSCRRHIENLKSLDLNSYSFDNTKKIEVLQTADIDLSAVYSDKTEKFTPIKNKALFGDYSYAGKAYYNGNDFELQNLIVDTEGEGGFFARTYCDIINVNICNPSIKVSGNNSAAGSLVGTVYGGNISYCGAYLRDIDKDHMYAKASVSTDNGKLAANVFGVTYSGGLLGKVVAGNIVGNFAAVNVGSYTRAGGFVGYVENAKLYHNYASGMVHIPMANITESFAGGFVGAVGSNAVIGSCSSFGDVHVPYKDKQNYRAKAGGFAGTGSGAQFSNCIAYGCSRTYAQIKNTSNFEIKGAEISVCGGFIAPGFAVDANKNNVYASQGYEYTDQGAAGLAVKDLTRGNTERAPVAVVAYGDKCKTEDFDYRATIIPDGGTIVVLPHYGDWPLL